MMHIVLLQQIMPQYAAYVRDARKKEYEGKNVWEYELDDDFFEDKWFTQQGIKRIRSKTDKQVVCALGFESEGHYLMWMLRWV
jgi:hypothetical protein